MPFFVRLVDLAKIREFEPEVNTDVTYALANPSSSQHLGRQ